MTKRPVLVRPPVKIRGLVVGQVTHDRYDDTIVPGGCAFYGTKTWQALGAEVKLLTSLGADFQCGRQLEQGIDLFKTIGEHTTVFTNTYPEDSPRIQWVEKTAPDIDPKILPEHSEFDVAFLAPVFGEMELSVWRGRIDAKIVGLGLQGFLKKRGAPHPDDHSIHEVVSRGLEINPDDFQGIDVVFFSEEDVEVFADESLIKRLRKCVPLVVMTRGEKGSIVFQAEGTVRIGVAKPAKVIDPTGAGDTFAAAFLFALALESNLEDAGRLAAAASSIVVEGQGGECLSRVGQAWDRLEKVPIL